MTAGIVTRWMSFEEHGEQILSARRQVYVEEQGFEPDIISLPYEAEGLHLGAFQGDRLIAAVSAYVHENNPAVISRYGLPPVEGRIVQFGKRLALPEHRGAGLSGALVAILMRAVYETLRPQYAFCTLAGVHRELEAHYTEVFGFSPRAEIGGQSPAPLVMTLSDEPRLRAAYLKTRRLSDEEARRLGLEIPSLVRFLERTGRLSLVAFEKLKEENLYSAPLSLKDELPRLSAQTRVLYREQKSRLDAVDFPDSPARILDLGSGPGVYLSLLTRESKLRDYEFVGLEASIQMVLYSRLNRPDLRWIHANAYDTGEPDQSYDVVHSNFLFMHLLCPALGLREIHRLLKPGGLFYIFEVDDSTFTGPPAITELVEEHCDLSMSNRRLMSTLPALARQHGFELAQHFSTRVTNAATQQDPTISGDTMALSRVIFWGLLSFMGQREELAEKFRAAQELYFNSPCEISVQIPTHVFRKVSEQ